MSLQKQIESVVINGETYPYVSNPNTFEHLKICYDDNGTIRKINVTEVEDFILAS